MNEIHAVAYVRISSLRQINNESPATQREAIQRYADQHGIIIDKWFEDIARSGKNADRSGLQALVKYCAANRNKLRHWLVYNMKRASRDIDSYSLEVRVTLKALGVTIRSATEPAVDDTKEGRFMENLLVLLGQLDNEGKSEVTLDNMRSLALQGYWQHPAPLGYAICKIPNDLGKPRPSLTPSDMSSKVKQVLERYSEGNISKADVTRYAAMIGLRSRYGKKVGEDSMNRILKNAVYAGYVSDKFTDYELVEGKHQPIISRLTFERIQSLLYSKNSRKNERHSRHNVDYPLRGLICCINCNKPMYASAPRTGSGTYSKRYHCARSTCTGIVKSVKADTVHEDFQELLRRVKPDEGTLKLYKRVLVMEANTALGKLNGQIGKLRNDLSDLDTARVGALRKFSEETITLEEKSALIADLDDKKLEINEKISGLEKQQYIRESDIETAILIMDNVDKQWASSDLDIQAKFQKMLFPEGLIYDPVNHRFGTSKISPLYRVLPNKKDSPETEKSFLVAYRGSGTWWPERRRAFLHRQRRRL